MSKENKAKKCGNCKFAGNQFKLGKVTHLHCMHPETEISGKKDSWDTLREWYNHCKSWSNEK